ncbi:MAG: DUF1800 domain-containing protein [Candidatus Eremiobacteraeota bacterium]|nr:DUF1800 domain-containing protein [Candidatus Eremiobacteraeota bacterium]
MSSIASGRPAGRLDIARALQPYHGPWDLRLAAHLLRRAGFGGSPADVERFSRLSPSAAVDALVGFDPEEGLADVPPGIDTSQYERLLLALNRNALSPQQVVQMLPQATQQMAMSSAAASSDVTIAAARAALSRRYLLPAMASAQRWWLGRMLLTQAPLQEKMTLFWHGHFTSEVLAKGTMPREIVAQNQLFRRYALGNVRELTRLVAQDPAMLKYLDNARSQKAHPNENFARELMELFTMGIGNYGEQDVRESARAFTGWTLRRNAFFENPATHDDGVKTFLGRRGNFDGNDIVEIIFQQPATARWFAGKLLSAFLYNDPEPELVTATANLLRKNGYELRPVMAVLLRSNVFYSNRAYRALVKSPVEFVVGAFQLYGISDVPLAALAQLARMGQTLFRPPSVKGWDGGMAWLNSQSLLTRENFASALLTSPLMPPNSWISDGMPADAKSAAARLVWMILHGDTSTASLGRLVSYLEGDETTANGAFSGENFAERIRGAAYLTMAMPAYQLC